MSLPPPSVRQHHLRDAGGSAFLLALIVIVLLTILGVSIVLVTETEMALGSTEKSIDRSRYAAETGLWAQIAGLVLTDKWHDVRVAIPLQPDTGRPIPGKQMAFAVSTSKPLSLASGCPAWTDCGEDVPENEQFASHFVILTSTAQRVAYDTAAPYDPADPATFESPFAHSVNPLDRTEDQRFAYDATNLQILGQASVATGFMVSPLRGGGQDTKTNATDATVSDNNGAYKTSPPAPP